MDENVKTEVTGIPAGLLDGTVRALVAAVQRLAEENMKLRAVLESVNIQVEEPDGSVLEMRVEMNEPITADADRAWLAAVLRPGAWTDAPAYAAWLQLARALGEELGEWQGEGAAER